MRRSWSVFSQGSLAPTSTLATTVRNQPSASCLCSAPPPLSLADWGASGPGESERAGLVAGRYTPFHVACAGGHVRCATLLRNAGADTSLRNDIGLTGWELAAELRRGDIAALEHTPVTLTDAAKCAHDRS